MQNIVGRRTPLLLPSFKRDFQAINYTVVLLKTVKNNIIGVVLVEIVSNNIFHVATFRDTFHHFA